jgi:hypothetical protein
MGPSPTTAGKIRVPLCGSGSECGSWTPCRGCIFPLHCAGHQSRFHVLARAHRLHRALPQVSQRIVALGDRACLGIDGLRRFHVSHRRFNLLTPGREVEDETAKAVHSVRANNFPLQLMRIWRTQQYRQPRRLHHAPARTAQGRNPGQPGKAQGAGCIPHSGCGRRHTGDLRYPKRKPEDR